MPLAFSPTRRTWAMWVAPTLICLSAQAARGQYVARSLAELRTYSATLSNATVTLAPGDYWIDGSHIANPKSSEPTFLELGGTGNTYDLSAAQIKLDTRKLAGFGRALAHDSGVEVVKISGSGNTVRGLNLTGYDVALDTDPNARRYADWAATYVQMTGTNNKVLGANVLTRGSSPYGYGDVFGKGARVDPQGLPASEGGLPWIAHNKTSAFQVIDAVNPVIDGMHLDVRTYGHGFFVQGTSTNTTLKNSAVTGQLFSSNDVIASAKYQEYGMTSHGNPLPPNIMISGNEDGVRMYTGPSGLTVENVVVTNMRTGFSTALGKGTMTLKNVEAYGTEGAFNFTSNTTIIGAKGDITHGPLIHIPYDNVSNSSIEVELVGGVPEGVNWSAAYLNGDKLNVTISSKLPAGALPADSLVRFGQTFFENWRDTDHPTGPADGAADFINSTFINNTNQMLVLGKDVTGNTGASKGMVVTNGKDNAYDGVSVVLNGSRVVLTHVNGLGNNGAAAAGTLDSNGSIVQHGATLELQSGIKITNEKLAISGDGVDGKGALFTNGSVDSGTRFGSSSKTDESTIVLNGDASIGVGVAGNQLLIGQVQGTGNLTKRGPGTLSMEKSSSFTGDLIVAEGGVFARTGAVRNGLTVNAGASIAGNGDMLQAGNGIARVDGTLDLNGRTDASVTKATVARLDGFGQVRSSNPHASASSTLELAGTRGDGDFIGTITGRVSVTKAGSGRQSLGGTMTHTGTTSVTGGTLAINGTHTGGGAYSVIGATLGGSGTIAAPVTIGAQGVLAPGNSAGWLTVNGPVTFGPGSTFAVELAGVGQYDVLAAGATTLAGDLAISLLPTGGSVYLPNGVATFDILTSTSAIGGTFANVLNGGRLNTVGGEGSFLVTYGLNKVTLSGFAANVVPEPASFAAVAGASVGLLRRRRR